MEEGAGGGNVREGDARRVLEAIEPDEVVALLRALVRVPSVNPPGDVRGAIALCEERLRGGGFSVRTEGIAPEKPNLIAELGGGTGPTLCCNAHVDVVPTGAEAAWSVPPFAAELVDGRVYGRGAGDDKASVTAQVMAGVALARAGVRLGGRLVVNVVADEETDGSAGSRLMVEGGHLRPDYVIVGEQTLNRVCVGEKGFAGTEVTVFGRAAHGALPWEGANAIEGMARVVEALRAQLWPALAGRTHPYFHPSSAAVTMIDGGVKVNVVPDRCTIQIDRRLIPGENPAEVLEEIAVIARGAVEGVEGLKVETCLSGEGRAATMNAPDSPLVRAMVGANRFLGLDTTLTGFSMATDGRFFVAAGYPTIIYGPGDPRLAHVPDEWVGVDEVLAATRAYALAALALIGPAA
jgi:succinyl-diaminopimelate desuccinylase